MPMIFSSSCDISHSIVRPVGALPVRPRPMPREAAVGYLIRIAQSNGFATPRQLWHALHPSQYQMPLDELMDRVGVSIKDRKSLLGPLPNYWKSPANLALGLAINDYNHSCMRWCPLCLMESPYLHEEWGLKLQCVCTRHRIMLVDRCPACGAVQHFERSDIAQCPCGARLAVTDWVATPTFLNRMCEWLANGSVGHASINFPDLSAAAWHRLVRYLGQFTADYQPPHPGQIAGLHHLELATAVVINVANLLEDWPQNFNMLLSATQKREPVTQSLQRSFGRLYRVLYVDLQASSFQFLRDAFEAYLHVNWYGFVGKRNRSLRADIVDNHPRLTLQEAAHQAGTNPAVVRHLIQSELIPGIEGELPSGRHVRSVHQQDIEQIVILVQGAMTLIEAARLLALPKRRVRELAVAGVLTPIISRQRTKSSVWLFSSEQLMKFSTVTGLNQNNVKPVSLKYILKSWHLRDGEFVVLVKSIEARELIPVIEKSVSLGEVVLDAGKVHSWLTAHRTSLDGLLSIDQAASILGVKQQVAYELVDRGFLCITETASRARKISIANLRIFKETYVSLVDLADHQKRSPKWTLRTLDASPVCGPLVDGSRQYFFRRSDVCAENLLSVVRLQQTERTQRE